jgi:hypothetical protein
MALSIRNQTANTIKVICRLDAAVPESVTTEKWDEYLSTLDESLLELTEVPSRFILKKVLSYDAQIHIQNIQANISSDGRALVQLGYVLEEIRCSLVGIEHPNSECEPKFSKESDGYASKELIALLSSAGVIQDLFRARTSANAKDPVAASKK